VKHSFETSGDVLAALTSWCLAPFQIVFRFPCLTEHTRVYRPTSHDTREGNTARRFSGAGIKALIKQALKYTVFNYISNHIIYSKL
jgi:hypothetical protein